MKMREFRNAVVRVEKKGRRVFAYIHRKGGGRMKKMSAFDTLKNKIAASEEKRGVSAKTADKIGGGAAYNMGKKKYGKSGMTRKAVFGKMKAKKAQ